MHYVEMMKLNIATGISGFKQFRLNGPFDPSVTGSAVQPMGYDEWSAIYERQETIGCKVSCTFFKQNNNIGIGYVYFIPDDDVTTYVGTEMRAVQSRPQTIMKMIMPWNGAGKMVTLKKYYRIRNWIRQGVNPDNLQSLVASLPLHQLYLNIGVSTFTNAAIVDDVDCRLKMTFYTIFSHPDPRLTLS